MSNIVTEARIDGILEASHIDVYTKFNKCTIVTVKLPCGFILTESSGCVDVGNYDENIGKDICLSRIKNKVWELEGYRLQCEVSGW